MKHIIFDQDGTLFDTEFSVSEITADVANEYGASVSATDIFINCAGYASRDKFNWAASQSGLVFTESDLKVMGAEHEARKSELYNRDNIPVIDGVETCLETLKNNGVLLSVGSSNPTDRIRKGLSRTGLDSYFNDRVFGPDLVNDLTKPNPAIFNLAIAQSGISSAETAIIEDSIAGIKASAAAGAFTIAYMDPRFESQGRHKIQTDIFRKAGADLIVSDYAELTAFIAPKLK